MANEINRLWRAFKRMERGATREREEARFNAIRGALKDEEVRFIQRLGPHGVRLRSMDGSLTVDYWPGRGTMQVVGSNDTERGVSWAAVLRKLNEKE